MPSKSMKNAVGMPGKKLLSRWSFFFQKLIIQNVLLTGKKTKKKQKKKERETKLLRIFGFLILGIYCWNV